MQAAGLSIHTAFGYRGMTWNHVCTEQLGNLFKHAIWTLFAKLFTCISSAIFALFSSEQIEMQLAEYHKLARKLKLIPVSAENSKGHDFEIQFNPEAGPNCLVKYRTQIKVSRVNTDCFCYHSQKNAFLWKYWKGLNLSVKLHWKACVMHCHNYIIV